MNYLLSPFNVLNQLTVKRLMFFIKFNYKTFSTILNWKLKEIVKSVAHVFSLEFPGSLDLLDITFGI